MDNVSFVRVLTLSGFNETSNYRMTLFSFTLLYYCLILFCNICLITIIILDENLHEPMYVLLCSLFINELYGTTGFYPKFLLDLLSSSAEISYEGCLLQAFIMYSFACCDFSVLSVMAYDRYLAICRPLHYHSLMCKRRLAQLVCFSWLTPLCIFSISIILTSTVKLCGSRIQKIFCVNWLIYKLACSDSNTVWNNIVSYVTIIIYVLHGVFIAWTYMHLVKKSVRSKDDRVKIMQTCVPHLISLSTALVIILFDLMYSRFGSTDLPQGLQNLIATEFLIIPPLMNPLIYGFKLTKIRNRILYIVNSGRK
ncbi:putative gustatory receptor clone PTE01 [Solea solea]|uniref:putative gustatory receptor clone PTE01 n=1 Tax=Solea solea TaxID=90069 RepID=UPI00272C90F3|nr:putative gustatory receptor clone PTE01 [Solea solea]